MSKRRLSLPPAALLVTHLGARPIPVHAQDHRQEKSIERVKAKVAKLGTGEQARVEVTLKDGKRPKGYIYQAGQDEFVITENKTQTNITVAYGEVAEVLRNKGHAKSTAIVLGVTAGVGVIVVLLLLRSAYR